MGALWEWKDPQDPGRSGTYRPDRWGCFTTIWAARVRSLNEFLEVGRRTSRLPRILRDTQTELRALEDAVVYEKQTAGIQRSAAPESMQLTPQSADDFLSGFLRAHGVDGVALAVLSANSSFLPENGPQ